MRFAHFSFVLLCFFRQELMELLADTNFRFIESENFVGTVGKLKFLRFATAFLMQVNLLCIIVERALLNFLPLLGFEVVLTLPLTFVVCFFIFLLPFGFYSGCKTKRQ